MKRPKALLLTLSLLILIFSNLIDKKGKILAIDPSAEEVRKILEEHL